MVVTEQATNKGGEKMGTFIAFEGIDGCGKNTQLLNTFRWLNDSGRPVFWLSEPNEAGPIGKAIKAMLRGAISRPADPV